MRKLLTLTLTLALGVALTGCNNGAAVLGGVSSSHAFEGSDLQTRRAMANDDVEAARIDANKRREIAELTARADSDVAAIQLMGAAKETAAAEAEAILRAARQKVASEELAKSIDATSAGEEAAAEAAIDRDRRNAENRRLRAKILELDPDFVD